MHAHMILNILLRRKKVGFNATIRENRIIVESAIITKQEIVVGQEKNKKGRGNMKKLLNFVNDPQKIEYCVYRPPHRLASLAISIR